jgi:hypothetical protein
MPRTILFIMDLGSLPSFADCLATWHPMWKVLPGDCSDGGGWVKVKIDKSNFSGSLRMPQPRGALFPLLA